MSTDLIGSSYSSIFDAGLTTVVDGTQIKVVAWYDNEWGYSSRLVELAQRVSSPSPQAGDGVARRGLGCAGLSLCRAARDRVVPNGRQTDQRARSRAHPPFRPHPRVARPTPMKPAVEAPRARRRGERESAHACTEQATRQLLAAINAGDDSNRRLRGKGNSLTPSADLDRTRTPGVRSGCTRRRAPTLVDGPLDAPTSAALTVALMHG